MPGRWGGLRIEEETEDKETDWWLFMKGRVFWQLLMFYLLCSETEEGTDTMTDRGFSRASINEKV